MRRVLEQYGPKMDESDVRGRLGLERGGYFLVSAHREENVAPPERLGALLDCLRAVRDRWAQPVIVSTHPRTRQRLEAFQGNGDVAGITFSEPFGFYDYGKLQMNAHCGLSDSGPLSKESSILTFPTLPL